MSNTAKVNFHIGNGGGKLIQDDPSSPITSWDPSQPIGGEHVNFWAKERMGFTIPDTIGNKHISIFTPTLIRNPLSTQKGGLLGDVTRHAEQWTDGQSHTFYIKFKLTAGTVSGDDIYWLRLGKASGGTGKGILGFIVGGDIYLYVSDGAGNREASAMLLLGGDTIVHMAGWCELFITLDFATKTIIAKLFNATTLVQLGSTWTQNITGWTFNTNDNTEEWTIFNGNSTYFDMKKFNAIKTIAQCRDMNYVTDLQLYVPDLLSGVDVSGNGIHFYSGGDLDNKYWDTAQKYLLEKGCTYYRGNAVYYRDHWVPNDINGNEIVVTHLINTTKQENTKGSMDYLNCSDALIEFIGDEYDRSNITIYRDNARVKNAFIYGAYDITKPKRWHTTELNELINRYQANSGYQGRTFTYMKGGSIIGRNYFKEFFSYDTDKSIINQDIIYGYCEDICLKSTSSLNMTSTQGATPVQGAHQYIVKSGAKIYLSWGDGAVTKLTADDTFRTEGHTHPTGNTEYPIRFIGELDKLLKYNGYDFKLNVDVGEFAKSPNIWYIGVIYMRSIWGNLDGLNPVTFKEIWCACNIDTLILPSITGNLDNFPLIQAFEMQSFWNNGNMFTSAVTGDFSKMTKIRSWCAVTNCHGDISRWFDCEYLSYSGSNGNRMYGCVTNMTKVWSLGAIEGMTGHINNMPLLEALNLPTTMDYPTNIAVNNKLLSTMAYIKVLTEAQTNAILAAIWLNREEVRNHLKNTLNDPQGVGYRWVNLTYGASHGPTGQGVTDFVNLSNTVSPVAGNGTKWDVDINGGDEVVNNPLFAAQGNWVIGAGFTISSNKLNIDATGFTFTYQVVGLVQGATYVLKAVCDTFTKGQIKVYIDSALIEIVFNSSGTKYLLFTATSASMAIYIQDTANDTEAVFSEASIKRYI